MGEKEKRESAFFCSLSLLSRKGGKNIFASSKISWCKKETKEEKKHPKEKKIFFLRSLSGYGEAGLFLSPPSSSSSSSAVFVKYRAAREERKQRAARGRKNPDIWWREEVVLGVLLIERSVFARAFSPYNFPSEGIFIGLFFSTHFSSFWWENCCLLKPSFSLSSDFFFCRFGKEGNEEEINTKNYYGASTSSVDDSLYNTLLQKEGRIDLERFFLVENFQRRGERKFALRRVERKREREGGF